MRVFFIIFVLIPLAEISVFMLVGEEIGIGTTLLLALGTAVAGGMIVKHQGMRTISAIRTAADRGQLPLDKLFDGICLVAAGALLITPGFVTDTAGFLLLVPTVRDALRKLIRDHTDFHVETFSDGFVSTDPNVIEGEYRRTDETGGRE